MSNTSEATKDEPMTNTALLSLLVSVLAFLVGFAILRGSICAMAARLKSSRGKFDLIDPVLPSGGRRVQPVVILTKGIGSTELAGRRMRSRGLSR
ncbi:MAG TPA: hypothetical protein VFO74_02495 [Pseudolabrys sp.]|nr:hypothetical protein [Pseudolabrys sp.]